MYIFFKRFFFCSLVMGLTCGLVAPGCDGGNPGNNNNVNDAGDTDTDTGHNYDDDDDDDNDNNDNDDNDNDDNDDSGGDTDSDSDGDGDMDVDGDSDGDSDMDTDSDTDTDTDEEIDAGDDCDTENQVILYLSADDSNSMAGPALARALINQGDRVTKAIRTYEFLNYYNFNYEAAQAGHVNVTAQMRVNEEGIEGVDAGEEESLYNLQIGVRAPNQDEEERRQLNITLSLDTSGSMSGWSIELVRESCKALASSFRSGDVISIVTWNSYTNVVLESYVADGSNDSVIIEKCDSLEAGGTTDLHNGLVTAYELARANFNVNRINRVILMSDGGANTGITDDELIAQEADDADGEAIYLMGVGMGEPGYYNDDLMDTVTDKGKGAYIFIDSAEETQKMFGERFLSNVEVAARSVQVELTLPPSFEMVEFHGEEYSEDPEEVEPQHLAPNDAMIFHQAVGSCDQSVVSMGDIVRVAAIYEDPITRDKKTDELETTLGALLEGDNSMLLKGDAIVAYAEALKKLKSFSGDEAISLIDKTLAKVTAAKEALEGDPDLAEISSLLTKYRAIF